MEYLIKTNPKRWKLEQLYFQYKHSCNSFQDARAKLKSDLNDLIQSELCSDKAKKSMKALLNNLESRLKLIDGKVNQQSNKAASTMQTKNQITGSGSINNITYTGDINKQTNNIKDAATKAVENTEEEEEEEEEEETNEPLNVSFIFLRCLNFYRSNKFYLALNGIIWIDERNRRSYKMSEEVWELVSSQMKMKYKDLAKPNEYKEIETIAETVMTEGVQEGENKAAKYQADCASKGLKPELLRANKTHDMINKLKQNDLNTIKEPLFCSLVVDNLVAPFLCSNGVDIILQGSSDPSIGSKERRGSHGRVPDLSLLVKYDEHIAMPFLCEVKTPSHMQGLNPKDVQDPDFIKLANIMKDELDQMDMIEEKEVYGLLVEGFKCQLFVLDHCFYKVYRFFMIDQFYLPRDLFDLHALVPCFRRLDSLEVRIKHLTNKILDDFSLLPEEGVISPNRRPTNQKLVSFLSPHRSD
ncbi:hypothetical protein [Parasitella parasitica]|uniref:Uncharacterized protein n=1 Tax=Parasitella parasitica TaxID=35722 RepID=A0A0B7NMJ9_9FUNG|nr:hypothetical protein [Parasitella parasitica]